MLNKWVLLVAIICSIFLQSCFVVGLSTKISWDNTKEVGPLIKDTLKLDIYVSRGIRIIPIPFFLLSFEKNDYGILINMSAKKSLYKTIDSATYVLSDLRDYKIEQGSCSGISKEFSCSGMGPYDYCQGAVYTGYNIKIPKTNRKEDLKIHCVLFLHDINGKQVVKTYSFKLVCIKTGPGIAPLQI